MAHLGDEGSPHNRAPGFADRNTSLRLAHPSSSLLRPLQRTPQRDFWYHAPRLAFPIAKVFFARTKPGASSPRLFFPLRLEPSTQPCGLALLISTIILTPARKVPLPSTSVTFPMAIGAECD